MKITKILGVILMFTCFIVKGYSQQGVAYYLQIIDGDTIPVVYLKDIEIKSTYMYLTEDEIRKNHRLIHNVKKVYPYAQLAKTTLEKYNTILENASSDKERKELMKKVELDIDAKFSKELKELTFSQGKVLLKLVDRETGNASFYLVQELRGKFRAFFYQTFAKVFGYDLKSRYNPYENKEDRMIERILLAMKHGQV